MPVGTSQRPHSNLSLIAAAALLFCGHPHICKLHHASAYTGELPPNFRFSLLLVILLLWQALALLMGFNHGSPFFPCGDIIAHLSAIYYPFPVVFCQTHDFVLKKHLPFPTGVFYLSEKERCDLCSLTEIMQQEDIKKLQQHTHDQKHRSALCNSQHCAAQFIHPADHRQLHRAVKRIFQ